MPIEPRMPPNPAATAFRVSPEGSPYANPASKAAMSSARNGCSFSQMVEPMMKRISRISIKTRLTAWTPRQRARPHGLAGSAGPERNKRTPLRTRLHPTRSLRP